jgi:hypothetical protein
MRLKSLSRQLNNYTIQKGRLPFHTQTLLFDIERLRTGIDAPAHVTRAVTLIANVMLWGLCRPT